MLAFAFHLLVRKPLLRHLPPVLYRRLGRFTSVDWVGYFRRYYWSVIYSIIIGALLHLFWDSFTHPSPQLVAVFPFLPRLMGIGEQQRVFFFWVTMLNSVLGGAVVCWAVWRMPVCYHEPVPATAAVLRYWAIAGLTAGVLTTAWLLVVEPDFVDGTIVAISAGLFGIVVASLYVQYAQRRQRRRQARNCPTPSSAAEKTRAADATSAYQNGPPHR